MDIVTHAAVGAATGYAFGHPVAGAFIAAAPDVVLGIRRRALPSKAYDITHSLLFLIYAALSATYMMDAEWGTLVFWCLASHIALDLPTHGPVWAPPLLHPFTPDRFVFGAEWEFFNLSWVLGLGYAVLWALVFIMVVK